MLDNTIPAPHFGKTLGKATLFSVVGGCAAFALFVVMAELATNNATSFDPPLEFPVVEILTAQEDTPAQVKPPQMPEPPTPPERPPQNEVVQQSTDTGLGMGPPDISIDVPTIGIPGPDFTGPTQGDAMPIVRVNPKYPITAARDGIEGWVTLSFTIDELGRVTDISVMDANPKRIFNQEARKALKKWKYKPKLKDGKAVKQLNQSVLLEFKLGGS